MTLSQRDHDALRRLEEELGREETRFDAARMRELLAPDFFEFGRSGRVDRREDTLAIPRAPIDAVLPLPGFRARALSPDVAQVTYDSEVTYGGVVQHARRSSIWSRSAGCCGFTRAPRRTFRVTRANLRRAFPGRTERPWPR